MTQHPRPLTSAGELRLPCLRCGHNLRSVSLNASCPSCGLAVRASVRVGAEDEGRLCRQCGYSLQGLVADRCPECGASIPGARAAVTGIASHDARCGSCGSSLRPIGGRCPECGAEAAEAAAQLALQRNRLLVDDSLSSAPPRVAAAVALRVAAAAAGPLFLTVAAFGLQLGERISGGAPPALGRGGLVLAIAELLAAPIFPATVGGGWLTAAIGAGLAAGGWLLTWAPEARGAVEHGLGQASRLRKAARLASLAWVGMPLLAVPWALTADSALRPWLLLATAGALCSLAPLALHLKGLAAWMRDDRAERLFNGAAFCAFASPLLPLLLLAFGASTPPWLMLLTALAASGAFYGVVLSLSLLGGSAAWSVLHAFEHERWRRRRLQRARAYDAEVADRARAARGR